MALGKLQASLTALTSEVTVTAANLNFDFALFKFEAPREYHTLGQNLSPKRKDIAESGSLHITARRLGALFEGVCPPTPRLLQAYGTRVSEISEDAKKSNPSVTRNSIFADHSGIDGTSIWAAATSSTSALHVQLLACMLARMFKGNEATSAWAELVAERRKELAGQFDAGASVSYTHLAAACQAEIPRTQLQEWDASARSWIQTADRFKSKHQTQLRLILDNIEMSVNDDTKTYPSIISAWTSALSTIEKLIDGSPQAIKSGPALLALSSWHIYPDMVVVGGKTIEVISGDNLVAPGGVLTLGVGHPDSNDGRGIYWSLSLAHVKHYGRPIQTSSRLSLGLTKIPFAELMQAAFGAVLANWGVDKTKIKCAAEFFVALFESQQKHFADDAKYGFSAASNFANPMHSLNLMAQAATSVLSKGSPDYDTTCKLVSLGMRRSSTFIAPSVAMTDRSFFGLVDPEAVTEILAGTEERIEYLRAVASRIASNDAIFIIRYYHEADSQADPCYASVIPWVQKSSKRKAEEQDVSYTSSHYRWVTNLGSSPPSEREVLNDRFFSIDSHTVVTTNSEGNQVTCTYLFGDQRSAAVFVSDSPHGKSFTMASPILIEDLTELLTNNRFSSVKLYGKIEQYLRARDPVPRTLKALSAASAVYSSLPDANVSVDVLRLPLFVSEWALSISKGYDAIEIQDDMSFRPRVTVFDRKTALSCVAYFESPSYNVEPKRLEHVFALSSGDSLYVAAQLICDPYEDRPAYELKRVFGNVGRPGISMLLPPQEPMIRPCRPEAWKFINHAEFDGQAEDHFSGTTVHLSFTNYNPPVFGHDRGLQDSQLFFLESIISVYDSKEWVADVDILRAINHFAVHRTKDQVCVHDRAIKPHCQAISIDSWDELLERPEEACIIRANGNWIARLAIMAVLVQQLPDDTRSLSLETIRICPRSLCWSCTEPAFNFSTPHLVYSASRPTRIYIW